MSRAGKPRGPTLLIVGWLALSAAGCGPPEPAAAPQTSGAPAVRDYQVRGVLEALPTPADATVRIRHEAIPELLGPSGEVTGMAGMTMPFPLAAEVDLAQLAPGDPVRFVLRVDWDDARPMTVTAIEPLPADPEPELD